MESLNRRLFNFPLSTEKIEIITTKKSDGTFKKAEAIMTRVQEYYNKLNDKISGLATMDTSSRYVLSVSTPSKVMILKEKNEVSNPHSGDEVMHNLSEKEIKSIKSHISDCVEEFIEMFADFHSSNSGLTDLGEKPRQGSLELANILKFSSGAKVRYLEDLFNLYVALNGQTYFDIVANVIMTNAYTLSSLFSITGLYFLSAKKLRGNVLLKNAIRSTTPSPTGRVRKGEIHTTGGLMIFYSTVFRIRQFKPRIAMTYQRIELEDGDDDLIRERNETPIDEQPSSSHHQIELMLERKRKEYESTQYRRLLIFGGDKKRNELLQVISDYLLEDSEDKRALQKITFKRLCSIGQFVRIIETGKIGSFFQELSPYIYTKNTDVIICKILTEDFAGDPDLSTMFKRNLGVILGMNDVDSEPDNPSLFERLTESDDVGGVLLKLLTEFTDMVFEA